MTWYIGQCLAYGQTTPYLPVREIVQQACALAEGDLGEANSTAVRHRLNAMGSSTEEDVALLLQLLDLPGRPETLARLSPEARHARTFALLSQLVLDEAQRQPLILVVENLHWIDPTSEAWLAFLVERLAGAAVLLLVTHRPGYQPPWGTHAIVTQLALPPLRTAESQAVVQAIPGAVQLPAALCQQIVARGAGNPFFVEELAWHAVEHGPSATSVPETVHAVLAARMDRLPSEAKHLLQTAAVLGMQMTLPLLQAVTAWSDTTLHAGLQHLQAAEFLYETRVVPTPTYTFKHALIQEVAYGSLLQEWRQTLHAHTVAALETLAVDRVAEVERLAYHALRGEVWDKALVYCRQAGEKAMGRWAHREAVGYFEQALSVLPHLSETRGTREQGIDLRLALRWALLPSCNFERILAYLREAESLAIALDDSRWLSQILLFLSCHCYSIGLHDQAMAAAQRTLAFTRASGDSVLHGQVHLYLGIAYQAQGDYHRAIDCFRQTAATFNGV